MSLCEPLESCTQPGSSPRRSQASAPRHHRSRHLLTFLCCLATHTTMRRCCRQRAGTLLEQMKGRRTAQVPRRMPEVKASHAGPACTSTPLPAAHGLQPGLAMARALRACQTAHPQRARHSRSPFQRLSRPQQPALSSVSKRSSPQIQPSLRVQVLPPRIQAPSLPSFRAAICPEAYTVSSRPCTECLACSVPAGGPDWAGGSFISITGVPACSSKIEYSILFFSMFR